MADRVFALFETREEAERGVRAPLDAGCSEDQIGMAGLSEAEDHPYGKSLAGGVLGAAGTLLPVLMGTATATTEDRTRAVEILQAAGEFGNPEPAP